MWATRFDGKIIDYSQHQGVIRWREVAADNVTLAIGRATMGTAGTDARFEANYAGVTTNGIASAFYHLLRTDSDPVAQARHFLRAVDGKPAQFLAPDVEHVDGQPTLSQADYAARLRTFLETLDAETNTPIWIYTSPGEWAALVGNEQAAWFSQWGLWNAHYTTAAEPLLPTPWKDAGYKLWQFTSSGKVAGIDTRVDMNKVPVVSTAKFTLQLPVPAPARVTQVYGERVEYYKQFGLCCGHEGTDYGGKDGDPIYAAADGVVKLIAKDNGVHPYGNHVRITSVWHADTFEHIYAHLRGFKAELVQGDTVHAGDVIGYMGSTGNSSGVHLHLTLKRNGVIVDPTPYLKA